MTQDTATYSLTRSPTLLIFQQNPNRPLCSLGSLGFSEGVSNNAGLNVLACVVTQINNNKTTINDGKSNNALILNSTNN